MKNKGFALTLLLTAATAVVPGPARAQSPAPAGKGLPLGPGDGGATLKQPWLEPAGAPPAAPSTAKPAAAPSYIQGLLNESGAGKTGAADAAIHASLLPYDTTGINNDILVRPEHGPWMILLISYSGPEGPVRARKMVSELRSAYKLPAYVFNYGAEEKRKEFERVKAIIDKQKEVLKQNNLPIDQPIRVRHLRIDEHCGVLVGGYPTEAAAIKAREQMRKLAPPDPSRVDLDLKFIVGEDGKGGEAVSVNPFTRAILVHNPTVKVERPAEPEKLDIQALQRMNSEEAFSLLKCKRAYTLVIKQFSTPSVTGPRTDSPSAGFWSSLGFGKKTTGDEIDLAAKNAHELVEGLRRAKLEAYVLHTKFYSLVTIGGFDGLDDPNLRSMQNLIVTRLNPAMQGIQPLPQPLPMAIPR